MIWATIVSSTTNQEAIGRLSKFEFSLKPWLIALPTLMLVSVNDSHAMHLDVRNHWVKDYLDFGQNKGIFERGATGLELVDKNGNIFKFPDVPFPDFSIVSNHGPVTSIGGAYIVTATHNKAKGDWVWSAKDPAFGMTTYHTQPNWVEAGSDFSALRLDKFVVETTGILRGADFSLSEAQFKERYGIMYNGQKQVLAYRTGSGVLNVTYADGRINYINVSYKPELRSGSLFRLMRQNGPGDNIDFKIFNSFSNSLTAGDSGSGVFLWDNENEEWVIAGVLTGEVSSTVWGSYFNYSKWNQNAVDTLKKRFTHDVKLDAGNLTFDSADKNQYTINGGIAERFEDKKDLSFKGGGTINLSQNLNLGIGGLIFDEGKEYTVNGTTYTYKGAGIDIGKDTTVHWNIKGDSSDNLHKIGAGTLIVNETQGNNLKVGNGTVLLKAQQSFNNIYLANGYAKVKLERADALNTKDLKNGIYFAARGGVLDLNGFSHTFERIAASDDGAIVTSTGHTKADVNFKLPKWAYAYHGQFQGNLNVKHQFQDAVDDATKHKERHLILDGGMKIDGAVSVQNAKLTMQGLPITHSTFGNNKCNGPQFNLPCFTDHAGDFYKKEEAVNQKFNSLYKSKNQRNFFEQSDWKTRIYKFDKLSLDNAVLGLGRNSKLYTNIEAQGSSITFGGDAAIYRDNFAGENVTGFNFRQELHEGTSDQNQTIYYEGNIVASNSTFTSHLPVMAASFDLKDGSKFTAVDKTSLTRILDKGIKVEGKSSLELGNIVVQDAAQKVSITKSADSQLSIENVEVKAAQLQLPGEVVNGALKAYQDGSIYVDTWKLQNSNLTTQDNGKIYIDTLESSGQQVADANLTISKKLEMRDLNPNEAGINSNEWIGLNVKNEVTLEANAEISAKLSNDYLSLKNMRFNNEHTLLKAQALHDLRNNKGIDFTLAGNAVKVSSDVKNNSIVFSFGSNSSGNNPPSPIDEILNTPVGNAFLEQSGSQQGKDVLVSILEHNNKGSNTFQEVAIKDALSMSDVQAGVEALNKIVKRTNDMFDSTAKTISKESMVRPIRNILDSRLAVLRRSARSSLSAYYPVADLNYNKEQAKKHDEEFLTNSIYVDVSVGHEEDSDSKETVMSSSLGYDNVLRIDNGRMVLGGAFSITKLERNDHGVTDDAMMHSLTGYLSLEQKEGLELQSYLTVGYLRNDRSFMPEIFLGEQTFDEESWMLMSSNYFKYHFRKGALSIKPMLLADLGFSHTSSSESEYLKRDSLNDASLDLGLGLELEGTTGSTGMLFQFTARKNVYSSADSVGINLKNANSFISYGIEDRDDVRFAGNLLISKRLKTDITLDAGAGLSATTGGAVGVNANARIRWLF